MNSTQNSTFEPGQPLLITVDELSRKLNICTRSIWRGLIRGEMIKPVRLGKSVRWSLAKVEAWIEAGCPRPDDNSSSGKA
jgi:predicted DNA-binding transcriptional regulator AlpA